MAAAMEIKGVTGMRGESRISARRQSYIVIALIQLPVERIGILVVEATSAPDAA
jgi:hypothetical protein